MPRRQKFSRRGKNRSAWVYARGSHLKTPKATKTRDGKQWTGIIALGVGAGLLLGRVPASWAQAHRVGAAAHVPVVFSGGHETDPEDRGRPVALVAGGLGVPAKVFRDAFRHVHPAPAGTQPDPEQVHENKDALLAALSPYGVTNEDLDRVSDYYRYVRSRGEHWPATPAAAYALVKRGRVIGYVIASGGSGYSSPPTVTVPGVPGAAARVRLVWSKTLEQNGSVAAITTTRR